MRTMQTEGVTMPDACPQRCLLPPMSARPCNAGDGAAEHSAPMSAPMSATLSEGD